MKRSANLKRWRKCARVVAFSWAFDLDHLGAEIAQLHGAVGTRKHPGQVDDAKSIQRAHCSFSVQRRASSSRYGHECLYCSAFVTVSSAAGLHGAGAAGQYDVGLLLVSGCRGWGEETRRVRCLP